jgi:hypothetical protein
LAQQLYIAFHNPMISDMKRDIILITEAYSISQYSSSLSLPGYSIPFPSV